MEEKNYEEWIDLEGTETERTYHYPDMTYTIKNPSKLYVKKSGSHKIIDADGTNHYITAGFRTFTFEGSYTFNLSDTADTK